MSIYLDEKNPEKHKPFDDASPDIVAEFVLNIIQGYIGILDRIV